MSSTAKAFRDLLRDRQGGGLSFAYRGYDPLQSPLYRWASKAPSNYKPFTISIFQTSGAEGSSGQELITLSLLINPADLQIGNVFLSSPNYTRKGWVTTLWGQQQSTISANGTTGGFYYQKGTNRALTNYSRKDSISFINLLSLMSIFKNNGANFSKTKSENDMFKSGNSRVINVMDSIKISYDNSEYLGEFISFTLDEDDSNPFKITYSFEYIIHSINMDSSRIEGHVRSNAYDPDAPIALGIQGSDNEFAKLVQADEDAFKNNYYLGLRETAKALDESSARVREQYAQGGEIIRALTEEEKKDTGTLLQAQRDAGGKPKNKSFVSRQIKNIRQYNQDVGQNKTAQQVVDFVNYKLGYGEGDPRSVTLSQMNGVLLMENDVSIALEGGSFLRPGNTSARGISQIVEGTYEGIVKLGFDEFMEDNFSGYTKEEVADAHKGDGSDSGLLDTDSFLGYVAAAYLIAIDVNPRVVRDGYEPTEAITGLSYHGGPKYNDLLRREGTDYAVTLDTYKEYLRDPNKPVTDLRGQ